jgi:uncharacterized protein YbgA (DUF1722 family)/uncharacterized protein YbbK (DUF523 family)
MSSVQRNIHNESIRPAVLVSRCLSFEHCRWNGDMIASPYIEKLKKHIDFITVCPESDIGLGVPRKPVRLVHGENGVDMVQHETGKNCTAAMNDFSATFFSSLQSLDGFIYKEKSPSCGMSNVKIHSGIDAGAAVRQMGSGLFGASFKDLFPLTPICSEGHLYNFMLREHFYTQIYTLARFRSILDNPAMKNLVDFHARHKLILMSYHQTIMRQLGKLVANHEQRDPAIVYSDYQALLCKALAKPPKIVSPINVLMHAMGYFSEKISTGEKKFFLDTLEQYRHKKIPLSVCNAIIKSWIVRFDEQYLAAQYFFEPYPEALVELSDSGK